MTDRALIRWIIDRFEGHAFTNRKNDRGGATKFGVTQGLYASFLGRPVSVDEVRTMTIDVATDIMHSEFLFKPGYHHLHDPLVKLCAVDFSIHSGAVRGVRSLQYAAFPKPPYDGVLGPITLAAVNGADPDRIRRRMLAYRLRFITRLIRLDPRQAENAEGWGNRLALLSELGRGAELPKAA